MEGCFDLKCRELRKIPEAVICEEAETWSQEVRRLIVLGIFASFYSLGAIDVLTLKKELVKRASVTFFDMCLT